MKKAPNIVIVVEGRPYISAEHVERMMKQRNWLPSSLNWLKRLIKSGPAS